MKTKRICKVIGVLLAIAMVFWGASCKGPDSQVDPLPNAPPKIAMIKPPSGSEGVAVDENITLVFNKSLDGATMGTIALHGVTFDQSNSEIYFASSNIDNDTVVINPDADLIGLTAYTGLTVQGFKDETGEQMDSYEDEDEDEAYYFTTAMVVYVCTEADGGDDANPGTQTEPKLTIQGAINAATAPAEVHVAEGSYEIEDEITMENGVSIVGGYSEDFSARDIVSHETIITDIRTPDSGYIYAIYCSGISGPVRIDGFTINGANAVSYARSFCIYNTNSNPTISNNKINGGAGAGSEGIYNQSSSPVISNNTINGGQGQSTYCIMNQSSSQAIIMNNVLNAGGIVYGGSSNGIYNFSSNPIIINNIIHGGIGYYSYGIFNDRSSPDITNNTINGGSGSAYSIAIMTGSTHSSPPYSQPFIRNNIIFTEGSGTRWGIHETDEVSDPASVRNNTIFDCPDALYRDEDSVSITAIGQDVTTGEGAQTLEFWDNINEGSIMMFVDFPDGDWHLTSAAPLDIRGGGVAISGFASDKDGSARTTTTPTGMTNPGAAGWSMGAYEKD